MVCSNCGTKTAESQKFCQNCGTRIKLKKTGLTYKQKGLGIGVLVLLLAIVVFTGIVLTKENKAKGFIESYGNRYDDPLSTYYAEMAYRDNVNDAGSIMTDKYINDFEISTLTRSESSEIGFEKYKIAHDIEYTKELFVKIFNEYTAEQLSRYMNLLSKNTSKKAIEIIDSEFRNYCSSTVHEGMPAAFSIDDVEVNKLMKTAKAIVSKYGSAANYSVALAEIRATDPNKTSFPGVLAAVQFIKYDEQIIKSPQYSGVRLVISIDQYNKKEATNIKETIKNVELTITTQPYMGGLNDPRGTVYISIGQR